MAKVTHTVVKGDTLSEIAVRYGVTVGDLVRLNNISDPDYIVVGQVLTVVDTGGSGGDSGGSSSSGPEKLSSTPVIDVFGLQSNTDRTIYATWTWDKSNTEEYQTIWYYDTGDGVWFIGSDSTTKNKQSLYTAPTNALRVRFKVKAVSKKYKSNDTETSYWTAGWSTLKIYSFSSNPPTTPPVPKVEIKNYTLTASLDNLDVNGTHIEFQIVKNDASIFNSSGAVAITTTHAAYSCAVTAGNMYKVRCRAKKGDDYSPWSQYSENVGTIPSAPAKITTCRASSATSVYLAWDAVQTATSYEIEYTTKKEYFDGSDQTTVVSNIASNQYEKTGLASGDEYFFRVRAVNDKGYSGWSEISVTAIGKTPVAPTTWSSTTTATPGEPLTLYWMHNAEDGSMQTFGELELYINGLQETHTIKGPTNEEDANKASTYVIDTSKYVEGVKIRWRVRTAGVTKVYGDWSVERTVDIYAPPVLELNVTNVEGESLETLESFPFYVSGLAGPNTQIPIGYYLAVVANEAYETVDNVGRKKIINSGDTVYSKYFDISDPLLVEMSAGNIDLENNIRYTITCTVTMDSGLTAQASESFVVAWEEVGYEPNAEIGINPETYAAYIRPYCRDGYGYDIEGVLLSVYRREFDGGFTELATDLDNTKNIFITDPHPALDYARYRIVAKTVDTGAVTYYDIPGYPVGCKAAIIQWDEVWSSFDTPTEDQLEQPAWSGSMLTLPYNIDVSDGHKPDVALVEYIGRKHPVSYYGTQLGETSTWNMEIPKSDKETIYSLRRLMTWTGDVYVREPSGSGYWANITVSFDQRHCELTVPVTIDIVRVEGGV